MRAPQALCPNIVISEVGACTCLGLAAPAAAAARAGIQRACELPELTFLDERTNETSFLTGHPIRLAQQFEGPARLHCIGAAGLCDLMRNSPWLAARRTALFLVFPAPVRSAQEPHDDADGEATPVEMAAADYRRLAERICEKTGLALSASNVYPTGRAGMTAAVLEAASWLQELRCDHAIVGAIDSALDPVRAALSFAQRRVKCAANPVGFAPGEAAAFVLLERADLTARRLPIAALLGAWDGHEESHFAAEQPATGVGMSHVLSLALEQCGLVHTKRGTIYVDLNGEPYRADDWGHALTRLRPLYSVGNWHYNYPAINFGETSAASPALAMLLAVRSFARGYAAGEHAFVVSADDAGHRGVIGLQSQAGLRYRRS